MAASYLASSKRFFYLASDLGSRSYNPGFLSFLTYSKIEHVI